MLDNGFPAADDDSAQLYELRAEIGKELIDEKFLTRVHYSRATYAAGCHGPLCKKAERDRGRKRTEYRAEADGREYFPNHDIRVTEHDAYMNKVITWHIHELEGRRIAKKIG